MNRLLHIFSGRRLRNRSFQTRGLLIVGFLVVMTLILPRSYRLNLSFEIGKAWVHEDLRSPFDFFVLKSVDSLENERAIAAQQVHDIYYQDSLQTNTVRSAVTRRISTYASQLENYRKAQQAGDTIAIKSLLAFFKTESPQVAPDRYRYISNTEQWESGVRQKANRLLDQVYDKGYAEVENYGPDLHFIYVRVKPALEKRVAINQLLLDPESVEVYLRKLLTPIQDPVNQMLFRLLAQELKPNFRYSQRLTTAERTQRRSLVSPILKEYSTNERVIQQGEVVDKDKEFVLLAFIQELQQRAIKESSLEVSVSQLLLIALITAILLVYLAVNRPRIYFDNNKLALIFFTFLMTVGLMVLAARIGNLVSRLEGNELSLNFLYLAPACLVPIFMRNFFGWGTAFLCNLLVALYGSVLIQQDLEYGFVQIIAGTVAIYSMTALRKRAQFWLTLLYVFLAYSLAFLIYNLYSKGGFEGIPYQTILLFLANTLATVIAFNLIFLFEKLFGITSDLTYLELLDTNHPLLKELARKTPGTFQHSLQVSNIAEAVISEIGGNELLVHVGALYHDIGKMPNPEYFIENMSEAHKKNNPHHQLTALESAQIIIGHVSNGIELAHKHHLPKEIIQFIQTHHGTTRVEYFYRNHLKAIKQKGENGEEDLAFRYPGPRPFSKETAVLMISDSIEAASRALTQPTPEKLKDLVNRIIDGKIEDGQLDDSNLTFKDLTTIRKVVYKQLLSIYHARIKYPEESPVQPA